MEVSNLRYSANFSNLRCSVNSQELEYLTYDLRIIIELYDLSIIITAGELICKTLFAPPKTLAMQSARLVERRTGRRLNSQRAAVFGNRSIVTAVTAP
jgi:hypothetical protein